MEDSWVYGGIDDPIRISSGNIAIFRNTEEKGGLNGGDGINVKGGTVGDMAYNFFIGNAVLVGHHIDFDVEMINAALERLDCGRFKNEALDVDVMYRKLQDINDRQFSLDELCDIYKIPKSDRNSSSEDAYKIALLFLKLKSRLGIK